MSQLWVAKTTSFPAIDTPAKPPASRCRVALGSAVDSAYGGALTRLLHSRLRVVVLIALFPNVFFFARNLIAPTLEMFSQGMTLVMHGYLTLVLAGLAGLLWLKPTLSLCRLRKVELALFGSIAAFFAWTQYAGFACGTPFGVTCGLNDQELVHVAAVGSSMRWFFLIVIYGVFIPNTWRRCALLAGGMALMPLVLTPVAAGLHGRLGEGIWSALPDMTIMMGTAVAVAVFGSYRLQHLEEKAFEAQQLGQYRLKRRLGAGGMGEVYLAEHLLLRRPCAVKLIRPEQAGDPTTLHRFEREVQAMANLTHWNTVEVYDYGHADDGTFYYVMEYLPGQNLEQLVHRHGPLPPARAIHFLRQVCRALREAHGVGLLHRDVKPSNILVCQRGGVPDVAKLLDFGLVQESKLGHQHNDRLTMQGTIVGSPPFMSPEQAAGRSDLDARSDVYGLGGVAYYLLTGQPPFVRDTAMLMLLAHAYEPAAPPSKLRPDVPADLEAVVLRCLEKDPAKRYPDADSLEKALAACRDAGAWTEEDAAGWWKAHGKTAAEIPTENSLELTVPVEDAVGAASGKS